MTDRELLLKAIEANPTESTPRLMYADWLDEHGTTDQDKARAEWIRLAYRKERKSRLTRIPGEPDWIRGNAHRLWPELCGLGMGGTSLWIGGLTLILYVRTDTGKRTACHVDVQADGGVTHAVRVPFLRAATVAVLAARDEPYAQIESTSLPWFAARHGKNVSVDRSGFMKRGLREVWDMIDAPERRWPASGDRYKLILVKESESLLRAESRVVGDALTRWARQQALNPLKA